MSGDVANPLFDQLVGPCDHGRSVDFAELAVSHNLLFQSVKPRVEDTAQCAAGRIGGRQPLDHAAVDRFQSMQRSFAFGDLHFRSGKALTFSALLQPPGEKLLPPPYSARTELNTPRPCR